MDILNQQRNLTRRAFVGSSLALAGTSMFLLPSLAQAFVPLAKDLTVQDVMDLVIKNAIGGVRKNTVDTLKSGKPEQVVTGIVTTMFATIEVINKAIALKANFIIAHEPTFYNHLDKTDFLEKDPVWQFKRDLLDKHGIAVWRCHDYVHSFSPDGIDRGVLQSLDWEKSADKEMPGLITLPATSLGKIASHVKSKLGIAHVRVIGDLSQLCSKVALLPGASGGSAQIALTQTINPDLLIVGELSEWETAEYIRDSIAAGTKRSLIVLGHASSEEPGMKWMAGWLAPQVRQVCSHSCTVTRSVHVGMII